MANKNLQCEPSPLKVEGHAVRVDGKLAACLLIMKRLPSQGIYSKRKEFAPCGSKFLSFWVEPFSEGDCCVRKQTGNHVVFLAKNGGRSTCVSCLLTGRKLYNWSHWLF